MPLKNEKDYTHIRLSRQNGRKIRRICNQTKRSINTEANLAVEQYKPRVVRFRDNGK